ncbi:MAG TPA: isoamylase early set domain-containing protein [Candidatus Eisenbacteria bacterium]|nr:isoamylase early set domain-containing protein [Candidatus Eisenbacteria bacterium]
MFDDDRLDREVRSAYRQPADDAAARRALERVAFQRARAARSWRVPRRMAVAAIVAAMLAVCAASVLRPRRAGTVARRRPAPSVTYAAPSHVVEFALVAPHAQRVAVVGDWNGWDPQAAPMRRAGASWVVAIPLARGAHVYGFVVDGGRWVSDPKAPTTPADAFGFRRSVVVVDGTST